MLEYFLIEQHFPMKPLLCILVLLLLAKLARDEKDFSTRVVWVFGSIASVGLLIFSVYENA